MCKYKTNLRSHSQWVIHELAFCPRNFSVLMLFKALKKKYPRTLGTDFSASLKHPKLFFSLSF